MGRCHNGCLILLSMGLLMSLVAYLLNFVVMRSSEPLAPVLEALPKQKEVGCCRGIQRLELRGHVVNYGSPLKLNSSKECCNACKATCKGDNGPCLCDSWVFRSDQEGFGKCWLKKQKRLLDPDWEEAGDDRLSTSGFVFGTVEAIVKMETKYGTLRIKLHPECEPRSFLYIMELLTSSHCIGCEFYRAEHRGLSWDSKGNHLNFASFGPPFGLVQGTLEAEGVPFKKIPSEERSVIQRGTVAWIGSGPEFFISLANHQEWKLTYSAFGNVVPEDMEIVEKIASLPTIPNVWKNNNVLVLEKPVPFWFQRINNAKK